jgi:hypothetical protein
MSGHPKSGQSLLEYAVVVSAVTLAMILMSDYVRRAFRVHTEAIEVELSGYDPDAE